MGDSGLHHCRSGAVPVPGGAPSKTVGSAYVGSNPTPATAYNPSSSSARRDHRRWLQGRGAEPVHPLRPVEVARCLARSQRWGPDGARSCAVPVLSGAVEQWVEPEPSCGVQSRDREVIAALACRFARYAIGTWTRGGAVLRTAGLGCPVGFPQARASGRRLAPADGSICTHAASSTQRWTRARVSGRKLT